ncbi:hypothetical protein ACP70R_027028 [Stipagrostis hirtigluma subsp. patula]
MDEAQQQAQRGHGGDAPADGRGPAQQKDGPNKQRQQQRSSPEQPSSLNPTAARLLREAIVSQPDGEKPAAAADILAFARSVDRVDSALE